MHHLRVSKQPYGMGFHPPVNDGARSHADSVAQRGHSARERRRRSRFPSPSTAANCCNSRSSSTGDPILREYRRTACAPTPHARALQLCPPARRRRGKGATFANTWCLSSGCPGWRSLRRSARRHPQRPHSDLPPPPHTSRGVDEIWGTFPARSADRVAVQARPNIGEVRRTVVVVVVAVRIAFRRRNGPRFGAQQRHRGQESCR
jgi:hypothetical protein